jgi:hypothetical protein
MSEFGRLGRGSRVRVATLEKRLRKFDLRRFRRSGEFDYPRILLSLAVTCGLRSGARDLKGADRLLKSALESRSMPELLERMAALDPLGKRP